MKSSKIFEIIKKDGSVCLYNRKLYNKIIIIINITKRINIILWKNIRLNNRI